jgi:prolyl oligopeptidase
MTTKLILLALLLFLSTVATAAVIAISVNDRPKPRYPHTRVGQVVETLHGVEVTDPYRWLEAADSEEVHKWIEAQNQFTRSILDELPSRPAIRQRLEELLTVGSISTPAVRGQRYFYTKREGKQNQPILYVRDGLGGADRVLVDPNSLSADATVALDWWSPSRDGRRLAYGTSEGGSEKSTLRLLDVETGKPLDHTIPFTRACSVAWKPDATGFYYTRYPTPGSVPAGEENYHRHVFFHAIGTDAADDPEIFGTGRAPQDWPNLEISPDGRWLAVTVQQGWAKSEVYVRDLSKPGSEFVPVIEGVDAMFVTELQNDRLYLHTNLDAPEYRVFAVDPVNQSRDHWSELIPARRDAVLENIAVIGGRLFCHYLRDASSRLEVLSLDGRREQEIELPTLGSIAGLGGEWDGREAFFGFTSFAVPPAIYRIDLKSQISSLKSDIANPQSSTIDLWQRVTTPTDASRFATKQVKYVSKDGTPIPMFILHRTGLELDGERPTVLYGYGGFNVNQTPSFIAHLPLWLEAGGVFCIANLRGGGEYGEAWHQAGMLGKKQNVFDDFIAAAEWLIENNYTNRDKLAISGGSNGGLLVGAALTQRPDLFRAVVCRVPLLDMLRYQNFRIAKLWIPEYGSADDPDQFRWLHAYSPYHRVSDGIAYPSVLLTTAESDSRVDPMHALKMAARLQAASASGHPILLRVESKAGHGAGKPLSKTIDEQTDVWSFLFWQLGVSL